MPARKATKAAAESVLVEILTEELPPKSLRLLAEAFRDRLFNDLVKLHLKVRVPDARAFATPRRLAVLVPSVKVAGEDRENEVLGPPVKAGEQAIAGFAKKQGVTVAQLGRATGPKGEVVVARVKIKGAVLDDVLPQLVGDALAALPIAKVMRWGGGEERFVRPVHGVVMLHGKRVVRGTVLGLSSSNRTKGHRFIGRSPILIRDADEYEAKLAKDGKVIADFAVRRSEIEKQLKAQAVREKSDLGDYAGLLDEVTALVEYPSVYVGTFDEAFLAVPQECLILTMRQNQKYFPLFDGAENLLPRFLIVSNMKVADSSQIVGGNERVIRPRFEDARFFYNQDRKVRLEARVPALANVIYHGKLGTQLERTQRIQLLAGEIARLLKIDPIPAERAAWLSKADLVTGMVGEFPELQGTMGRHYAIHDGETREVADAIEAHYRPRFAGDRLPAQAVGVSVALADKLDTLVGIFGIGLLPTGEKDPFALRRHGLGVIRILCEHKLPLQPGDLLKSAHGYFRAGVLRDSHTKGTVEVPNHVEVGFFIKERAKTYLREQGYSVLEIEAVLDLDPVPADYVNRLDAVRKFLTLPEAAGLAEADKRIRNILTKSGGASVVQPTDESLLQADQEKWLLQTTRLLRSQVDTLIRGGGFSEALLLTAQVHQPVSEFFDKVIVNVDDQVLRTNRFALLHEVSNLTNRVANISRLAK